MKKILYLLCLLVFLMFNFACSRKDQGNNVGQEKVSKNEIALIVKSLTSPYFINLQDGAMKAANDNGYELIVKAGTYDTASQQQLEIIDQLISSKVKGIIISPIDTYTCAPALRKAYDKGIKAVFVDSKLEADVISKYQLSEIPYVSIDNIAGSYDLARMILSQFTEKSQVAIIGGIAESSTGQDRVKGFLKAINDNANVDLVYEASADWNLKQAYNYTATMINNHPDVKHIFCANDVMAMGVIQCLRDMSITDVTVSGFDNLKEIKTYLKDGSLIGTVDQNQWMQGYNAVLTLIQLINNQKIEISTVPHEVIFKSNISK